MKRELKVLVPFTCGSVLTRRKVDPDEKGTERIVKSISFDLCNDLLSKELGTIFRILCYVLAIASRSATALGDHISLAIFSSVP
ncbi:MAG: hypothetical protein ACXQTD_04945 [Candidatus Syntropharchaeia archaeon]